MPTPNITKKMALQYHQEPRPGKIEITPTKPYQSQRDLSLAYSPGVAYPCLEIANHQEDVYKYTNKGNLVGVISNGTAVLGLGDIGPLASKPVMEGKALLFRIFAGIDAFDIEVDQKDPDKFIEVVKALQPTFGGINLEDIKAPECFKIEKILKEKCSIPIMHDDQHGTAIISSAGLVNALQIQNKKIEEIKLVVNGAGAAAVSCTRLYIRLGVKRENVVMCDSKGVIRADNPNLSDIKREFATERDIHTLAQAVKDADVFLGLSVADVLTPKMVKTMAPRPIVFALANPDPEIKYEEAMAARNDIIVATGRSDYPNQINNVIGFPYIFRGALDVNATAINEEMKVAAVYAIAKLAKEPVPSIVDEAYGIEHLKFGPEYIIPKALDPRLLTTVAPAVAKAAMQSGVAKKCIKDWEEYDVWLRSLMGDDGKFIRRVYEIAKRNHRKVIFSEPNHDNVLTAVVNLYHDGTLTPVLLGNAEMITKRAERLGLNISDIEIINPRHDDEMHRRERFAKTLAKMNERKGITYNEALEKMYSRTYFGMMLVETGEADAMIDCVYSAANKSARIARDVIGIKDGYNHFATMHILTSRQGTFYLSDTAVNAVSTVDSLVDITRLTNDIVSRLEENPVTAMLSYSNFGSNKGEIEPDRVSEAVKILHDKYPEIEVDGEMQPNFALDKELRDKIYPFNSIAGKDVNTLIFPTLDAANITYRMLLGMGVGSVIGPIQIGLKKEIHFISATSCVRDIMNLAAIACLR
ncbi:MAG: NADP-dependent malic enzyme [Prevotella sp.]|nr:NADP-dependent malic enzyme [Bacteroides sp.]MCM1365864.1 NADP-dependent malic enzyme [Prevotella sp.]